MAGRQLALNAGATQYTCPVYSVKKCFIAAAVAGDITTTVNTGRQAGPKSSLLLFDVYGIICLRLGEGCKGDQIKRANVKTIGMRTEIKETSTQLLTSRHKIGVSVCQSE